MTNNTEIEYVLSVKIGGGQGYRRNKQIICWSYELLSSDSDYRVNPMMCFIVMVVSGRYSCLVTAKCSSYHIFVLIHFILHHSDLPRYYPPPAVCSDEMR